MATDPALPEQAVKEGRTIISIVAAGTPIRYNYEGSKHVLVDVPVFPCSPAGMQFDMEQGCLHIFFDHASNDAQQTVDIFIPIQQLLLDLNAIDTYLAAVGVPRE